ncbi:MAG: hypothetical protein ACFB51_16180, partial [Anaerolineae bacterium]
MLVAVGAVLAGIGVGSSLDPAPTAPLPAESAALADFWAGEAQWQLVIADTGLPVGESDTVHITGDTYWSYLHASHQSAGVVDSCGDPVPFPGCVTRWVSTDGARSFAISERQCLLPCQTCPCTAGDRVNQQQYPRVVRAPNGVFYMA